MGDFPIHQDIEPEISGGGDSQSGFKLETLRRLQEDHPELLEHWMPIVADPDPIGRVFGFTALNSVLDVRDYRDKLTNKEK